MSLFWVIIGTAFQWFLLNGTLLVMGMAGADIDKSKYNKLGLLILSILLIAPPLLCIFSAAIVIYYYFNNGTSDEYWWYTSPIIALITLFAYAALFFNKE